MEINFGDLEIWSYISGQIIAKLRKTAQAMHNQFERPSELIYLQKE